jgi:hypothetical protein
MGAYCLTLAAVNRKCLPEEDQAEPDHHRAARCWAGWRTWGMLFYSMIKFGVTDLG